MERLQFEIETDDAGRLPALGDFLMEKMKQIIPTLGMHRGCPHIPFPLPFYSARVEDIRIIGSAATVPVSARVQPNESRWIIRADAFYEPYNVKPGT